MTRAFVLHAQRPRDWALLFALVAMWGSAFMFIKIAVAHVPPATIAAGRLAIGAVVLLIVIRAMGLRLPPFSGVWRQYAVLAFVGNALPFYLIAWGQRGIDSALAGILIAFMPLATLVLAHYFVRGEQVTRARAIGFVLGFIGIRDVTVVAVENDEFGGLAFADSYRAAEQALAQLAQDF